MNSGLINNTTVYPGPELQPAGTAIGWLEGQVSLIGSDQEARTFAATHGIEPVDAGGGSVIAGLIDSHAHLAALGLNQTAADLSGLTTVEAVISALGRFGADSGDEVIRARGLDEESLAEKRPPTVAELDDVFPNRPVFINDRGLHYVVCNTACIRYLSLEGATGGDGRLSELASGEARRKLGERFTDTFRRQCLRLAAQMMADNGVTSVHAIEGGDLFDDRDIDILLEMDDLAVDVALFWNTSHLEKIVSAGLPRMGGDILIDGSLGSRTAWLDDRYCDDPTTNGKALKTRAELTDLISRATEAGVQTAFHAIGDRAVTTALRAFEMARVAGSGLRHRIEHFGLARRDMVDAAERLGLVISTQPAFPYLRGGPDSIYESRLGSLRARDAYPLGRFAASEAAIAAGSDAPVTPPSPLLGIEASLNHPYESERLDLNTAVRWFTTGGAWASHQESVRGLLETGMLADMVLLGEDIRQADALAIGQIDVELTVSKGRVVGGKRNQGSPNGAHDQEADR